MVGLYYSAKLLLISLFFAIFFVSGAILAHKGFEMKTKHTNKNDAKAAGIAEEALMEYKTIASLNAQAAKA